MRRATTILVIALTALTVACSDTSSSSPGSGSSVAEPTTLTVFAASSLGSAKQLSGSYQPGFLIFAMLALVAFACLSLVKGKWRASWAAAASVRI